MKTGLYVFRDVVSGAYGEPFTATCDDDVVRTFMVSCRSSYKYLNTVKKQFVLDTEALCIGSIDTDNLVIVSGVPARHVFYARDPTFADLFNSLGEEVEDA